MPPCVRKQVGILKLVLVERITHMAKQVFTIEHDGFAGAYYGGPAGGKRRSS